MRYNSPGAYIANGLGGLGQGLGQFFERKRGNEQHEALGGLINQTDEFGDHSPETINQIATYSPEIAAMISKSEQQAHDRMLTQIGQIASVASTMGSPADVRNFLTEQTKTASPRLQKELLETLNMDDAEMMNDLSIALSSMPSSKSEGFTLSEGQTRFDANGNPIAAVDKAPGEGKGFDQEGKLRGEFTKFSKEFQSQNAAFGRIQASANDPTAAGDLALIFNFMKLLDPGSTVREGEFSTAQGAFGALNKAEEEGSYVPNFIKRGVQQLMDGTKLLPDQRKDFYGRARALFADAQEQHGRLATRYQTLSEAYDLDPSRVVIDLQTVNPGKEINLGGNPPQDDNLIDPLLEYMDEEDRALFEK